MASRETLTNWKSRVKSAWVVFREGLPFTYSGDYDVDSHLYRRLSGRAKVEDLEPYTRDAMIRMVRFLWIQNPMGRSIIEMKKDYAVGDGLTFEAKDEDVQAFCEGFWNDPVNDWPRRTHRFTRELLMWGEQICPIAIQDYTARVRFGTLSPDTIKEVVVDPLNVELPIGVIQMGTLGYDDFKWKTVLVDIEEDELSEPAQKIRATFTDGECFYFSINKLSNMTRGVSDIIQDVDMIDMYDEVQFSRSEKIKIAGNYFFDCTIEGADDKAVKAFRQKEEGKIPKPGSTKFHNEKVKWQVVEHKLGAADFREDMRGMKTYILAGVRFPEHFFAEGGEVNYATALSMHAPVNKAMRSFQSELEAMDRLKFRYVIKQGKKAGVLRADADEEFKTFGYPEIDPKDLLQLTSALASAVQGLSTARLDNVITDMEYRAVLRQLLTPFGVDLSEDDIKEELENAANRSDSQPYRAATLAG